MSVPQRKQVVFKRKWWGLTYPNPLRFVTPYWNSVPIGVFLAYRTFIAVYYLIWIVASGTSLDHSWYISDRDRIKWFIFLTNWNFFMMTLNSLIHFANVLEHYVKSRRDVRGAATATSMIYMASSGLVPQSNDPNDNCSIVPSDSSTASSKSSSVFEISMPWTYKVHWVLNNISAFCFVVVIMYWGFDYDGGPINPFAVNMHGVNAFIYLMDLGLCDIPFRIQHMYHGASFVLTYMVFSLIYTLSGGCNGEEQPYIYSILDWKGDPRFACLITAIAVCVQGVTWTLSCLVYWAKTKVTKETTSINKSLICSEALVSQIESGTGEPL